MNNPNSTPDPVADASREEVLAAHFAGLVMQNVNMALLFLGKAPHPETGEYLHDLDSARHFIDQLEMLEAKTKGNLDKREEGLLKQSLTTLRMAFVEAANAAPAPGPAATPPAAPAAKAQTPPSPADSQSPPSEPAPPTPEAEERKKFVKKY